jgi:transcriptional regulator
MPDDAVRDLLVNHGAGDLITYTDQGLLATLLPFSYDPDSGEHGSLRGHVARNNAQWRHAAIGDALVVLRGPDAYITPNWYATKREHGREVPTWNYVTAHVYGKLIVHDDVDYVSRVVHELTDKHEASFEHPWAVSDAPEPYVSGQLRAVVGIEVEITRIEAKAKLSQNHPAANIDGVITGLRERGNDAMADDVQAARPR